MAKTNRSASSKRWLKEHFDDHFVQEAKKQGWRSRAVFKLEELNNKDKLLNNGDCVVDLGAAPGGWSQYAASLIGNSGRIVACDLLPMDHIPNVDFLQGDFRDEEILNALLEILDGKAVDIVMSDMAPNMSGTSNLDQTRAMYLVELAFDMCHQVLRKGGRFVVKAFQGEGFDAYLAEVRKAFSSVKIRKPDSSRARSREVYIVASGYCG